MGENPRYNEPNKTKISKKARPKIFEGIENGNWNEEVDTCIKRRAARIPKMNSGSLKRGLI